MDKDAKKIIEQYFAEIQRIESNKKISPMTVPDSQAAAIKLATKLPAEIDERLAILFFSNLFSKGGLFREVKAIAEKHYPLLIAGLKHRILEAGGSKLGFLQEIDLRFALGVPDLKKAAKTRGSPTASNDFKAAVALIRECNQYSNFPNMLKKRAKLVAAFTPKLLDHAETTLCHTAYLGSDTSGKKYFVPSEFRLYWLLMIGILDRDPKRFEKILKLVSRKKLIKNKKEFSETLARI